MSAWRIGSDVGSSAGVQTIRVKVPATALGGAPGGAQPDADGKVVIEATVETPADETKKSTAENAKKAADVYTKWVPGEVIAIYIALTTAFRGELTNGTGPTPHAKGILIAGIALAAGLVMLAGIASNLSATDAAKKKRPVEIVGLMILGSLAFTFWSLCTPGSWWEVKGWNPGVLAAVSFAISVVFALVAEIVVAILKPSSP